jgi:hypothetical protein
MPIHVPQTIACMNKETQLLDWCFWSVEHLLHGSHCVPHL